MLKMGLGLNKSQHSFNLRSIPGLQLLALPNRDLATGWTSDIKVVQDFSEGGKVYGSELVTNGGFDSDSDWDKGIGWSISGGKSVFSSSGFSVPLTQDLSGGLTTGDIVIIEYSVTDYSSGRVRISGMSTSSPLRNAAGHYVEAHQVATPTAIGLLGVTPASFSADNFSVRKITNGNHGIYKNSMELNQVAGRTFYRFDATDDYIDFGTGISLTDNFSISVLFKTTDNELSLVSKYDYGSNQRGIWLVVFENKIQLYESDNGVNAYRRIIDNPTVYNAGSVNFVTLTKSGTALKSYVNGAEKVVTFVDPTTVSSLHPSTAPLLSGARLNSGVPNYFGAWDKGLLIINSGILTLQQHKQIYNSPEVQRIIRGM